MWKRFAFVAALSASQGVGAAEPLRVSFDALGALRIGMSEREVARASRGPLVHLAPEAEEAGCFYAAARGMPGGASLMFVEGRLARIDVVEPGVRTVSGAGVGTSEARLRRLYGARLMQTPHPYTSPEGHYLPLVSADGTRGMRFETDGANVTGYYAGTAEAIQYIEGCQ